MEVRCVSHMIHETRIIQINLGEKIQVYITNYLKIPNFDVSMKLKDSILSSSCKIDPWIEKSISFLLVNLINIYLF